MLFLKVMIQDFSEGLIFILKIPKLRQYIYIYVYIFKRSFEDRIHFQARLKVLAMKM